MELNNLYDVPMNPHLVVFKGGTAFNSLIEAYRRAFPKTSYVVPVSDDGGSSREICRVFGGPSIGDLRSTLTRLSDDTTDETLAVKKLLEYRLSSCCHTLAMDEWYQFLEGRHPSYEHVSSQYRGLIRCFLCKFEAERLQRISCRFDLQNGSIGNFFFTGARLVLGSLETAVFVYSSVAKIVCDTRVLPIIDTMDRLTIAALLKNGTTLIGQDSISHPSSSCVVNKDYVSSLPAPIEQLFYVNKYGDSFSPTLNHSVYDDLQKCHGIVYGIGSLWTSIIPSLILNGVGETIAKKNVPKVLLLNSCFDRETETMSAHDFILQIAHALNRYGQLALPPSCYVTHLFVVADGTIAVDEEKIKQLGVALHKIPKCVQQSLVVANQAHAVYGNQELINTFTSIFL